MLQENVLNTKQKELRTSFLWSTIKTKYKMGEDICYMHRKLVSRHTKNS